MISAIMTALLSSAAMFGVQMLAGIGLGFVVYSGLDSVIPSITNTVINSFSGVPSDIMAVISLAGLDEAVTIILSAYTSAISIKFASSFTRLSINRN